MTKKGHAIHVTGNEITIMHCSISFPPIIFNFSLGHGHQQLVQQVATDQISTFLYDINYII